MAYVTLRPSSDLPDRRFAESQRKIIPCLYKDCTLPANMKYLKVLDYQRNSIFNFWDCLNSSIQVVSLEKSRVNKCAGRTRVVRIYIWSLQVQVGQRPSPQVCAPRDRQQFDQITAPGGQIQQQRRRLERS
jgi:hypothetical protein